MIDMTKSFGGLIGPDWRVDWLKTPGNALRESAVEPQPGQIDTMAAPSDPLYSEQWHFGLIGDIETIWNEYDGTSVHVGVYDSAIEYDHPDFGTDLYDSSLHFVDSTGKIYDPSPTGTGTEAHGTSVAGLLLSRADNELGGSGVAPGVTFTGVNFVGDIAANESEETIIDALKWAQNFDIMSNSWGQFAEYLPEQSLSSPDTEMSRWTAAYEEISEFGRDGLGTVIAVSYTHLRAHET